MRTRTFGYLTLADCSQTDIIDAAAAAGFRSLGLRVERRRDGDDYPFDVVRNRAQRTAIRQRLDETGVALSNIIGRYLGASTTTDDLVAVADTAAELGARHVLANGYDDDDARMQENLARLAELAGERGLRVAIEFVPYQRIRSLDDAMRHVLAIGSPHLGLVPDPLHLSRSGGAPAQLAAVRGHVFYAQVCDAPAQRPATLEGCLQEARTGRLYPGEGGLPLAEYVGALPQGCEIEIEVANAADARLPPRERAVKVARALDRFLATIDDVH